MNRPSTPTELPQGPAPDRRAFRPLLGGISLLLAGMVGTSGCATIIHGTTQQVSISSAPSRAAVAVNGRALGQTPVLADLARKDTHTIQVTLEGYQPYEITLVRNVSGWVWGNIVFGGIIGLAVDAISGGLYRLSPEQVMAELRSAVGAADAVRAVPPGGDLLYLTVVLRPDPTWERVGPTPPSITPRTTRGTKR